MTAVKIFILLPTLFSQMHGRGYAFIHPISSITHHDLSDCKHLKKNHRRVQIKKFVISTAHILSRIKKLPNIPKLQYFSRVNCTYFGVSGANWLQTEK